MNSDIPQLQDFSLDPEDNEPGYLKIVNTLNQKELLALHSHVESKLGSLSLPEINLIKETLLQYQRAKSLQELASTQGGIPMNQRAQVQNSLANQLATLAKIQSDLFNSERIKRIHSAVVKIVKTLPKPQQDEFFKMLEEEFAEAAKETDFVQVQT